MNRRSHNLQAGGDGMNRRTRTTVNQEAAG